ncbi:replication protein A 32 kDa subunit C [Lolium perenne]|uniref:replication protein A 32 kDa subunit C n=1 Tax=Lolium perenne TaxID=4522 RepID=UPI0021F679E9|nr:replication protein A 32 kDa subunit C-like [Lolium perenne]
MAAAAASYFSGAAFMPSQRPGPAAAAAHDYAAATPSPSKPRGNPRYSGCVPATVRHIARSLAAADAGGDPAFSIDGVKTSNVRVLGKVETVVSGETDVSFTLDDGTGKIPLVRWIADDADARDAAYVKAGVYVRVHVDITGFQANQQGFARSIRPITNFNEVVLHFIECIHVHIENTRPKMQETFPPAVQTNAYTQVPYTGGVTEHQVHFAPQVNQGQLPPAARTNASTYAPFTGGVREHQVHFAPQVNQGQFHPTVQTNRSTYGPFSGGVRDHQIHQFAPQVNQSSAYSGTGGQQHDLQSKVLKVLQAPDIISLENGIHIDELAGRTGAPRTNIMAVINLLADSGFVCWTIDDFHVKCVCNG